MPTNDDYHHSPSPKRARTNEEEEESSSSSRSNSEADNDTSHNDDSNSNSDDSNQHENNQHDNNQHGNSEDDVSIDLDSLDPESLMTLLSQISASQNIPLSMLLQGHDSSEDEEEETIQDLPSSIQQVAEFIQSDTCQRILVLAGAGMSVAAGIPDYRSEHGFYATLSAHTLTATRQQQDAIQQDKTLALDRHLFLENPLPCLELKRDFILGVHEKRWKPTLAHRFCAMLAQQNKLVRWYTQNIDGLEHDAALGDKVVHVHGTMSQADCAQCGALQNAQAFQQHVRQHIKDVTQQDPTAPTTSRPMHCTQCQAPAVKPAIVLFRSSLPRVFFERLPSDVQDIDLLIVLGTSLRVAPANSIVWRVPKSCLRVVINRERVGEHLGIRHENEDRKRDFHAAGDCEEVVLELMEHLGWLSQLEECIDDLPPSSAQLLREKLKQQSQQQSVEEKKVDDRT